MRNACLFFVAAMFAGISMNSSFAASEEKSGNEPAILTNLMPARYIYVSGNGDKFQAQEWTKTGFAGAVKNFSDSFELSAKTQVEMKGRGILDDGRSIMRNDYLAGLSIKNEEVGFLNIEFNEFPKYYDTGGGVYTGLWRGNTLM